MVVADPLDLCGLLSVKAIPLADKANGYCQTQPDRLRGRGNAPHDAGLVACGRGLRAALTFAHRSRSLGDASDRTRSTASCNGLASTQQHGGGGGALGGRGGEGGSIALPQPEREVFQPAAAAWAPKAHQAASVGNGSRRELALPPRLPVNSLGMSERLVSVGSSIVAPAFSPHATQVPSKAPCMFGSANGGNVAACPVRSASKVVSPWGQLAAEPPWQLAETATTANSEKETETDVEEFEDVRGAPEDEDDEEDYLVEDASAPPVDHSDGEEEQSGCDGRNGGAGCEQPAFVVHLEEDGEEDEDTEADDEHDEVNEVDEVEGKPSPFLMELESTALPALNVLAVEEKPTKKKKKRRRKKRKKVTVQVEVPLPKRPQVPRFERPAGCIAKKGADLKELLVVAPVAAHTAQRTKELSKKLVLGRFPKRPIILAAVAQPVPTGPFVLTTTEDAVDAPMSSSSATAKSLTAVAGRIRRRPRAQSCDLAAATQSAQDSKVRRGGSHGSDVTTDAPKAIGSSFGLLSIVGTQKPKTAVRSASVSAAVAAEKRQAQQEADDAGLNSLYFTFSTMKDEKGKKVFLKNRDKVVRILHELNTKVALPVCRKFGMRFNFFSEHHCQAKKAGVTVKEPLILRKKLENGETSEEKRSLVTIRLRLRVHPSRGDPQQDFISRNTQLAVLLHELCHLRHMNHGKDFMLFLRDIFAHASALGVFNPSESQNDIPSPWPWENEIFRTGGAVTNEELLRLFAEHKALQRANDAERAGLTVAELDAKDAVDVLEVAADSAPRSPMPEVVSLQEAWVMDAAVADGLYADGVMDPPPGVENVPPVRPRSSMGLVSAFSQGRGGCTRPSGSSGLGGPPCCADPTCTDGTGVAKVVAASPVVPSSNGGTLAADEFGWAAACEDEEDEADEYELTQVSVGPSLSQSPDSARRGDDQCGRSPRVSCAVDAPELRRDECRTPVGGGFRAAIDTQSLSVRSSPRLRLPPIAPAEVLQQRAPFAVSASAAARSSSVPVLPPVVV